MRLHRYFYIYFLSVLFLFTGLKGKNVDASLALASIPPIKYVVEKLAGEALAVESFFSSKDDPHHLVFPPSKIRKVGKAIFFFGVGLETEVFLREKVMELNTNLHWVSLADGFRSADSGKTVVLGNSHYWMDPIFMRRMAAEVFDVLRTSGLVEKDVLEKRREGLEAEFDRVEGRLRTIFKGIRGKVVYTYHSAYRHLARRYGFRERSLLQSEEKVTPRQLARFSSSIRRKNIKAFFIEENFSGNKVIDTFARDFRLQLFTLRPMSYYYFKSLIRTAKLFSQHAK